MSEVSQICTKAAELRRHRQDLAKFFSGLSFDITPDGYSVLYALSMNSDASQAELSKQTNIDRSTISFVINKLAAKGWLSKIASEDRRRNSINLTREGKKVLKACLKAEAKFFK